MISYSCDGNFNFWSLIFFISLSIAGMAKLKPYTQFPNLATRQNVRNPLYEEWGGLLLIWWHVACINIRLQILNYLQLVLLNTRKTDTYQLWEMSSTPEVLSMADCLFYEMLHSHPYAAGMAHTCHHGSQRNCVWFPAASEMINDQH